MDSHIDGILRINVLDPFFLLCSAWSAVSPMTIANCFSHAGFRAVVEDLPTLHPTTADFGNIFERMREAAFVSVDVSPEDYAAKQDYGIL